MSDMTTTQPTGQTSKEYVDVPVLVGLTLALSFGVTMLFFTLLYVKDLETFAQIPEQVWLFICGRPGEDGVILPLLVLLTAGAFIAATGVWGWGRLRRGRHES